MTAPLSTTEVSRPPDKPISPGTIRDVEEAVLRHQSRVIRWLRWLSGNFFREFMYFWTARAPGLVLWTRPFFLWFAFRYSAVLRDGPERNARRLLGPDATPAEVEALRRQIIRNAYTNVYELGASVKRGIAETRARIEAVEGKEAYLEARRLKRGAILVTAHFGPFEVGAAALLDLEKHISVVFRRDERASFDRIRSRLRAKLGVSEISIDDGLQAWVSLREALQRDEVVLVMGDRVMPGHRGVKLPFLGGHIRVPTGPAKLARVTGAPLIPIFTIRTLSGRLKIVIEKPIYVNAGFDEAGGADVASRALVSALEKHVRAHPDQWIVFYRAWCEDEFTHDDSNADGHPAQT
jgi:phosphatidylinositol dimannoside acyltransferase